MGIYTGVDGVVREAGAVDVGVASTVRHAPTIYAGIDGVVRQIRGISGDISRIEIRVSAVMTYTVDSSNTYQSTDGNDLATATRYGSVTISSNAISVMVNTTGKWISVSYAVYVVYKDGHSTLIEAAQQAGMTPFSLSVQTSISVSGNGNGTYGTSCLGTAIYNTPVSGSATAKKTLTTADTSDGKLNSALTTGSCLQTVSQTFLSFTFEGITIPIQIINNLI